MDQLLAHTSFDKVYQPKSRWFPSRSSDPASISYSRKAVIDEPSADSPAKRQRLSYGEHEEPRSNNMDLVVGRDLEDPSYCAKSFLLLSTLASQEQDLLMPMAGIQVPDWGLAADHEKIKEEPYPERSSEMGHTDFDRVSRSDLEETCNDMNACAMPTASMTRRDEKAGMAVSSSLNPKITKVAPAEPLSLPTIRPDRISSLQTLAEIAITGIDAESPKITGDLEKDLGLVNDDIGWL